MSLPKSKPELYQMLGLVLAPLPETTCGGCTTCTRQPVGGSEPWSYREAERVTEIKLEEFKDERAIEYAQARERLERATRDRQRAEGYRTPTLAFASEWRASR